MASSPTHPAAHQASLAVFLSESLLPPLLLSFFSGLLLGNEQEWRRHVQVYMCDSGEASDLKNHPSVTQLTVDQGQGMIGRSHEKS